LEQQREMLDLFLSGEEEEEEYVNLFQGFNPIS
jgi:hypothetical protein